MPTTATSTPRKPCFPSDTTASAPATGRVTRLRAAKQHDSGVLSPTLGTPRQPGLIAMGKEGFRKVSGRIGPKEKASSTPAAKSKPRSTAAVASNPTESLKAYLRIRPTPYPPTHSTRPYLDIQSQNDVLMRAPADNVRHHVPKPPHIFSFDRVFSSDTPQSQFFTTTTLPLVEKLLQGENGLIFAYGVSNSGKSYTIQGGNTPAATDRGVLPRAIDVMFNSIAGLESSAKLQPQGLADVILCENEESPLNLVDPLASTEPRIAETVKVDRNFSYAVFVSYAEVYNEKIFDLLEAALPSPSSASSHSQPRGTYDRVPRASQFHGLPYQSTLSLAAMANGGGGVLKRQALCLKNDPEGSGKYIAGLRDVRVRTREEALAVFRSGQSARQVFGTLANRESSRSHGIFTIKVVRIHNGAPEDPDSAQVSRLAIVDLAGSERNRNTHTTGDRLKEAGNINKSLMVLGQCLEVLRLNQQKMAETLAPGTKRRLAVVPFRHSKLTEIFQNFFVGDGRAVIIINVNPYDTGFDENSHVMRFSASAREVQTTANSKSGIPLLKRQISTQFNALRNAVSHHPMKVKVTVPVLKEEEPEKDNTGHYVADRESQGFVMVEEELEIEEHDVESEDEDDKDLLVEYLFDQLKEMKTRLYESEMRAASSEVEVRDEMVKEMQDMMQRMQEDFSRRLHEQMEASELKADRKIDIIMNSMACVPSHDTRCQTAASSSSVEYQSRGDNEKSFESVIDDSLFVSDDSTLTEGPDPFMIKPPVLLPSISSIPTFTFTRESGSLNPNQSPHDTDNRTTSGDWAGKEAVIGEEEGSGYERSMSTYRSDEKKEGVDEEEGSDREVHQESEEEDDEDEVEDDQETDSGGSEFSMSSDHSSSSEGIEDEQSPRRKFIGQIKTTYMPEQIAAFNYMASITPKASPSSVSPAKLSSRALTKSGEQVSNASGPLSEKICQLQTEEEDDDVVSLTTPAKKKRTLGKKKVVTEADMERTDVGTSVLGAEVKRMFRVPK